jgi:hypothetical protein
MADEVAPLPELETPTIAEAALEPEVSTPTEPDTQEDGPKDVGVEDNENLEPVAEIEYVTLERNGKSYQVPKELEGEFLMQGDYTKKTQTVAERAKALDEREQQLAKQAEVSEAELDARATLRGVAAELAEYQKLTPADWQAHMQNDPLGTSQHRMRYEALRDQKAELEGTIRTAETQRTEKSQQDFAKRVQETLEAASTIIPGITAETRGPAIDKLVNFANSEGIPEQVLKDNWSPMLLKLLHKASIGAQAIAKQSAPKPVLKQPIAPLATVKSGSSPEVSKSLADLADSNDMSAYIAARKAGKTR